MNETEKKMNKIEKGLLWIIWVITIIYSIFFSGFIRFRANMRLYEFGEFIKKYVEKLTSETYWLNHNWSDAWNELIGTFRFTYSNAFIIKATIAIAVAGVLTIIIRYTKWENLHIKKDISNKIVHNTKNVFATIQRYTENLPAYIRRIPYPAKHQTHTICIYHINNEDLYVWASAASVNKPARLRIDKLSFLGPNGDSSSVTLGHNACIWFDETGNVYFTTNGKYICTNNGGISSKITLNKRAQKITIDGKKIYICVKHVKENLL